MPIQFFDGVSPVQLGIASFEALTNASGLAVLEITVPTGGRYLLDGILSVASDTVGDKILICELRDAQANKLVDFIDRGLPVPNQFAAIINRQGAFQPLKGQPLLLSGWVIHIEIQKNTAIEGESVVSRVRWLIPVGG